MPSNNKKKHYEGMKNNTPQPTHPSPLHLSYGCFMQPDSDKQIWT